MSCVPRPPAFSASRLLVFTLLAAAGLAACSGSNPTAAPAAATIAATASPAPASVGPASLAPAAPSAASAASSMPSSLPASSVPVAVDPCQLVTQGEASALAGTTFGPGKPETDSGGGKLCVYGGATTNVFMVIVGQAPDAATARAEWTQEQAKAQAALEKSVPAGMALNFKVNDVSSIPGADKAALASFKESIGNVTITASAVYLLKGPVFLSFSDLAVGHSAPATSAMEAQAATSLGRLP
jgi:hypothetical protein